ncbi:MAG: ATP phosphoribosyltransferase regulatory subunit [Phycisphaerales bacterium]|nr:ATP phosphoribosyltransferase regulatory subunit [Phycisphaerales bacterium]
MPDGTDKPASSPKRSFAAPTGTRDLYPLELARRRWIEDKWRKSAVRHGFEEVDGPTFEHTELYTAKSGDGIVGEIFSTFSGKDEAAVKAMGDALARGEKGAAPYALRPEFTPTLARMFAARGGQFSKPCKWSWQGPCYRAERPQRGRLREFLQWNCDLIGDGSAAADVEVMAVCVGLLESVGLKPADLRLRFNSRRVLGSLVREMGVDAEHESTAFVLLDRRDKLDDDALEAMAFEFGTSDFGFLQFLKRPRGRTGADEALNAMPLDARAKANSLLEPITAVSRELQNAGIAEWCDLDFNVARGLAYYTGTVFELHEASGAMRAVAGGGRYDNLIETFGGPPTPAVGFGMGDVVLSLVLQDKGLMPSDKQIAADLGLRPDVFVISNGQPESDALVGAYLADLRRKGMHARRSYKTTKNVGKLLQDAASCNARYAVIIESATDVTLKDMDANTQDKGPASELLARILPPPR